VPVAFSLTLLIPSIETDTASEPVATSATEATKVKVVATVSVAVAVSAINAW